MTRRSAAGGRTRSAPSSRVSACSSWSPGIALGITFVAASGFGKVLDFSHVYPTLVDEA